MSISAVDQINNLQPPQDARSPEALRRAATQFEAVLLMKLTAALNETNDDEENSLFGSDGGSTLTKQLFSEQLATSMAESGGVGLKDLILRQFGVDQPKAASRNLSGALSAIKDIREAQQPIPISGRGFAGNGDDAEVISTFEGQLRQEGIDDSLKNLVLNGKVVNTTRARVVPNAAVYEAQPVSANTTSGISELPADTKFSLPVNGRISSVFGNRFHPIDRRVKFHAGLDIAVPTGTPVGASADGVVEFAGKDGNYGNLVIIRHPDGRETRYGHLSELLMAAGEQVSAGQTIALSGSTGKSTGPHVHFEVRENGQVVNPLKVLSNVLSKTAER